MHTFQNFTVAIQIAFQSVGEKNYQPNLRCNTAF